MHHKREHNTLTHRGLCTLYVPKRTFRGGKINHFYRIFKWRLPVKPAMTSHPT